MTRLHLFHHHPAPRASAHRPRYLPTRGRWTAPEPLHLRAASLMLGLALVLGLGFLLEDTFAERSASPLLFLFACALLLLGCALLLFSLGQRAASTLRGTRKRCGCCRFFEVQSGLHVLGRCQADPSRGTVSCADSCPSFFFSERAMVRSHLAQHPRILQQLQIIRSSDIKQ
ncbi:MAG TPA: hypothetical protein VFU69_18610 [Ktedonobacterales bacterium]|nr:hypothetical protein [Ktedonobacterales bacterium]